MNAIALPQNLSMGMGQTPAPVEVDLRIKEKADPLIKYESDLSRHISDAWERAKFNRTELTERLLKCERQRRGVYDPDKEMEIARTGGSDIFMRITDIKCRAAASWLMDVIMRSGRRIFELDPSDEPDMPPEISAGIVELVRMEMQDFVATGAQVHPEAFRVRMEQVHDEIMDKMREEARNAADRMSDKIDDQMVQGNFNDAFRDFIDDFVTYPTAILKGPVVRRKKVMKWGPNFQPIIFNDFSREFERVSPHDAYPSPNASNPQEGYFIQRHRLSRKALQDLRGVPGYSDKAIDQVLERFGETGFRQWLMGDQERDRLEGKPHARLYTKEVIEALEFWGSVSGQTLINWGFKDKRVEWNREYEVTAWQIGPFIIKVALNPDPLGQRPYEIAQWNEVPNSFWGTALPEQMRDVQTLCNGSARSLANNMGIASGPQAEVQVDRLPDGEDVTAMFPWKIWQTTSDRTGGGQPAVRFFQPEMRAQELMAVYQYFSKQADEVTGIPAYLYSGATGGGAGRTASGLSMLMDNAAKGIKNAIASIDVVVSSMVNRLYMHNMMYDPDASIKGDFSITCKGALGLVQKEQLNQARAQFMQMTTNPVDMQIIGVGGRAYLLREMAENLQMDTNRLVPTPEMLEYKAEKQAAFQAAAQQLQGQGTPAAPTAPSQAPAPAEAPQPGVQQ